MASMEELKKQLEEMKKTLADSDREKRAFERDKKALEDEKMKFAAREASATSATSTLPAAAGGTVGGTDGGSGLSGAAGGAALPGTSRGMSDFGMVDAGPSSRRFFAVGGNFQNKPPSVPREPSKQHAWLRQLRLYLANEALEYTLSVDPTVGPVRVIGTPRSELLQTHSLNIIEDHTRAYSLISGSVANSVLDEKLQSCYTVADAWSTLETWVLPVTPAQQHLLEKQFNNVRFVPGADPRMYFAGFDMVINRMSAVGIQKSPQQLVDAMIRQLPDEFSVERSILQNQRGLTRLDVETTIGNAYAERTAREIDRTKNSDPPAAQDAPSDPHAFFVGGYQSGRGRGGGGGIRGRGRGLQGNRGFGNGGMGGSGYHGQLGVGQRWNNRPVPSMLPSRQPRSFQQSPMAAPQPKPQHFPPPGHPTWGKGGDYDCGSNAVYAQGNRRLRRALSRGRYTVVTVVAGLGTCMTSATLSAVSRGTAVAAVSTVTCAAIAASTSDNGRTATAPLSRT